MRNEGSIPQWSQGDRLAKALDHAGMSVQDMADFLEVTRNTIGNYTAGRTKINRATLLVWAERTGVDLRWLESGEAPNPPPTPGIRIVEPDPSDRDDALRRLTQSKLSRSRHSEGSTQRYPQAA